RRVVRVASADDRAERPVPGLVPDGLPGAAALRTRPDCPSAGCGSPQVLRVLGERLEPVELQAVGRVGEPLSQLREAPGIRRKERSGATRRLSFLLSIC